MKSPLIRSAVVVVAIAVLRPDVLRSQEAGTKPAQTAVDAWLALIDKGDYAATWQTAAATFKKTVTQEQWTDAARSARSPLGAMKTRVLKSATPPPRSRVRQPDRTSSFNSRPPSS